MVQGGAVVVVLVLDERCRAVLVAAAARRVEEGGAATIVNAVNGVGKDDSSDNDRAKQRRHADTTPFNNKVSSRRHKAYVAYLGIVSRQFQHYTLSR